MKERKLSKQCEKVLAYMKQHGGITQAEAIELSVYRLSGRIFDLRARGFRITSTNTEGVNKDGERVHFATYRLEKGEP